MVWTIRGGTGEMKDLVIFVVTALVLYMRAYGWWLIFYNLWKWAT